MTRERGEAGRRGGGNGGHPIRIAVASGKGGTGKTTIATNLAVVMAERGSATCYLDCDVEEPNGHIFLTPTFRETRPVTTPVPEVDASRCSACGDCASACRYSAIVVLPQRVLTFPKLCHGCGGCSLVCPEGAIREVPRTVGAVELGRLQTLEFVQGRLDVGEAMAPPVVRAVLEAAPKNHDLVIDAPPGTSCPVIESVKTADVVVLVTEPTPFGLNDLKLAVEMVRELGLPFGVVVNRAGVGDGAVGDYCAREQIPVLMEFPNDIDVARAYSRGELVSRVIPGWKERFERLADELRALSLGRSLARRRPAIRLACDDSDDATNASAPVQLGRKNNLRELVVISGKGGTGKTSIVASFFCLAQAAAVTDCDVDAADLHLLLNPAVRERHPFCGGTTAVIDPTRCSGCGLCVDTCRYDAIVDDGIGQATLRVEPSSCEGCGVCALVCPDRAIEMERTQNGEWFVSDTQHGPMVHARLGIAQENSGKLVSLVRREGAIASRAGARQLLIGDGSPGIGCPVIASITGSTMVLVVTEPTLSGLHDLERVATLTRQLGVKTAVCINKFDINPAVTSRIEAQADELGAPVLGKIRYDESVTTAQIERRPVVALGDSVAARDIRALWENVQRSMG